MKTVRSLVTVWVTVPGRPLAVKRSRLSVESGEDWQVVFKTHSRLLSKREALVIANHPCDTPQFLVRPIVAGSKKYLDWLGECAGIPPKPFTRRRSKTH